VRVEFSAEAVHAAGEFAGALAFTPFKENVFYEVCKSLGFSWFVARTDGDVDSEGNAPATGVGSEKETCPSGKVDYFGQRRSPSSSGSIENKSA